MQQTATEDYYHGDRYIGIDKEIQKLPRVHFLQGDYVIDDLFEHEQCLVIRTPESAVLLSGCAHNGILNILDRYQELYHDMPDHVISEFDETNHERTVSGNT